MTKTDVLRRILITAIKIRLNFLMWRHGRGRGRGRFGADEVRRMNSRLVKLQVEGTV